MADMWEVDSMPGLMPLPYGVALSRHDHLSLRAPVQSVLGKQKIDGFLAQRLR